MVIKDLVPVEWSNQRVLLSKQVALCYNCSEDRIKDNFNANKAQYTEGVHYFKIAGSDLQNLRVGNSDLQISSKTRTLYLWTYQGCVRHCKSINTPEAWEVFDELEKNYFSQKTSAPEIPAPAVKKFSRLFINVCVYVLLMSDDTVKVGYTKRFCKRISEIKSQFKLSVKGNHITPFMSCEKAQIVERCFKEIYSSQRVKGEIFSVDFDSACKIVNHFVELVSVPEIVSEIERAEKLLEMVNTLKTLSANQALEKALLLQATNIIVGKKFD